MTWQPSNPWLGIFEAAGGAHWHVVHIPSGERIARFKTHEAAEKFYDELAGLDWSFTDCLRVPMATWAGLLAALDWRGIKVVPNWELLKEGDRG